MVRETALEGVAPVHRGARHDAGRVRRRGVRAGRVGRGQRDARRRAPPASAPASSPSGIDLRGPDVAGHALRWLATVQPTASRSTAATLGRGPSEGIGLVVVVTGHAGSPTVARPRAAA